MENTQGGFLLPILKICPGISKYMLKTSRFKQFVGDLTAEQYEILTVTMILPPFLPIRGEFYNRETVIKQVSKTAQTNTWTA